MPLFLKQIWAYRQFIIRSIIDDYRKRYARSKVAALWTVLNPLVQVIVFALIFSTMLGARLPGVAGKFSFAIYMLAAVTIWGLFSECVLRTTTTFIDFGSQIKKIVFPKILAVAISSGIAVANFFLLLGVSLIFLLLADHWPGWSLLGLILPTVVAMVLGLGLGVVLGTLNVFMRDVGQTLNVVLQFWFWLCPCVYQLSGLPPEVKSLVEANPVTPLVVAFQTVLLTHQFPDLSGLLMPFVIGLALCALGFFMLHRSSAEMADAL
jgi:lipopolysaccharide transport system permease protein